MCGICGILELDDKRIKNPEENIGIMMEKIEHRGPDDQGFYVHPNKHLVLGHTRLSIIDLEKGKQPMEKNNCVITYNGEIYNYIPLQGLLKSRGETITTDSDTEVVMGFYSYKGIRMFEDFMGMYSFALWDESSKSLFCAVDRFGIKPFYYTIKDNKFYFASEIKALLPFIEAEVDPDGLKDYLTFQFVLGEKTLFKNVKKLLPGHHLTIRNGNINIEKYWENTYDPDKDHTEHYFLEVLDGLLKSTVLYHTTSDVPIGAYVSGGIDSGVVSSIASIKKNFIGFTGKFSKYGNLFDESGYAREISQGNGFPLVERDITYADFVNNIEDVIYYLDYPVAGPGSFSQYMISETASKYRKVVLGGQGGDEIFGGYTRYLIAYFEQCIKAAIDGTLNDGNFVVTYESIIPNLKSLYNYKPMIRDFWKDGLFSPMNERYYRLIDRSLNFKDTINWNEFNGYNPLETFNEIFKGENVDHKSYFDCMTNFDMKTLLPALLQVEDRVSMAHGLESRVPLLEREFVMTVSSIPSNIKFKNGELKRVLKKVSKPYLPENVYNRKDKMGFPTPINKWMKTDFVKDIFSSMKPNRYIKKDVVMKRLENTENFDRGLWGLFSLVLWDKIFF